jgi:D-lactate dehydrogenase
MNILATDQCRTSQLETELGVRYVPFEELLAHSTILTLHLPASPDTNHILNAKAFAAMKDGVVLVNTARGSLIDSAALLAALKKEK